MVDHGTLVSAIAPVCLAFFLLGVAKCASSACLFGCLSSACVFVCVCVCCSMRHDSAAFNLSWLRLLVAARCPPARLPAGRPYVVDHRTLVSAMAPVFLMSISCIFPENGLNRVRKRAEQGPENGLNSFTWRRSFRRKRRSLSGMCRLRAKHRVPTWRSSATS